MKWSKVVLSIMLGGKSLQPTTCAMTHNLRGGMRSLHTVALVGADDNNTKLVAPDADSRAEFGRSVAIDGDTIAVGAPNDDGKGFRSGAVYVVSRSGAGVWGVPQKVVAPADDNDNYDKFGWSVAISADNLVIGAPFDKDDDGVRKGSVYIVNRNGDAWDLLQRLVVSSGERSDWFGGSVAISGDNLVAGAPWVGDGGNSKGAAYVSHLSGNTWGEPQELVVDDRESGDKFGNSVAIDGDTIVVGSQVPLHRASTGYAYVFHFSEGRWETKQKLVAPDGQASEYFGHSVAISGDNLVVSSPSSNLSHWKWSVYVFHRTGGTWGSPQKILAPDAVSASDSFGYSVAIEGDQLVVGSVNDDEGRGSAYIYKLVWDTWEFVQKLAPFDIEFSGLSENTFGVSVAISGNTVVVGASDDNANGIYKSGSAWVTNNI